MFNEQEKLEEIRQEGFNAYERGEDTLVNPYSFGEWGYATWIAGWFDAKEDI